MKDKIVTNESSNHKIKMIITEKQFKKLAQNVALLLDLHIPSKLSTSIKKTI
jgi:hypothetical protein